MAEAKYDMTAYPVQVAVRSASDGAAVHMVTLPYCDCADFTNRKGKLTAEGQYVSVCKHIVAALERVGGWHREPAPAYTTYPSLSRQQAVTVLTSHYVSSDLTEQVLKAARAANGFEVIYPIATGELRASTSPGSPIWYTLQLPAGQLSAMPPEPVRV